MKGKERIPGIKCAKIRLDKRLLQCYNKSWGGDALNLYILAEPAFHASSWYTDILEGLHNAKNARSLTLCFGSPTEEFADKVRRDTGVLLLPGASHAWKNTALHFAFANKLYPMIVGTLTDEVSPPHCLITQDYRNSACGLYERLQRDGCKKIAFFGHNPDSDSDGAKLKSLLTFSDFTKDHVFLNHGSILDTCEAFWAHREAFDGMIFANDYAGVAYLKYAEAAGEPPSQRLGGFGSTHLMRALAPNAYSATLDFVSAGKKAAELYPFVVQNRETLTLKVTIAGNFATPPTPPSPDERPGKFFSDRRIDEIIRAERVLENADETDREILACLLRGKTIEKTSELCHMSTSGIKYRLGRLKSIGEYERTFELLAALRSFEYQS